MSGGPNTLPGIMFIEMSKGIKYLYSALNKLFKIQFYIF